MQNAKSSIWLFPFFGSILTFIAIFTPSAYETEGTISRFIWLQGFGLAIGGGDAEFEYLNPVDYPYYFIPGMITFLILLICNIILFIVSLTRRRKEPTAVWLIMGILLIVGAIYYIAASEVAYRIEFESIFNRESFWGKYEPGFAVIGPFLGGGLAIVGFIVGKALSKGEVAMRPVNAVVTPPVPAPTPTPVEISEGLRFCPDCGEQLKNPNQRFCHCCGRELSATSVSVMRQEPVKKVGSVTRSKKCLVCAIISINIAVAAWIIGTCAFIVSLIVWTREFYSTKLVKGFIIAIVINLVGLAFGISSRIIRGKARKWEQQNSILKAGSPLSLVGVIVNALLLVLPLVILVFGIGKPLYH